MHTSRFYPDDVWGYALGVHFDRFHPHAPALVFPRTGSRRPLNMSPMAPTVSNGQRTRVDFQGMLCGAFFDEGKRLQKQMEPRANVPHSDDLLRQWLITKDMMMMHPEAAQTPRPQDLADKTLSSPTWAQDAKACVAKRRALFPREKVFDPRVTANQSTARSARS